MGKLRIAGIVILILGLIAACQPEDNAPLPTLAVLPSVTPSATPTITEFPTFTPSPTATDTPTPTATFTATNTPTATSTLPPIFTATRRASPTFTATFTATATNTPPATITAIPTATAQAATIHLFQANQQSADPGSQVILRWDTDSTETQVQRLGINDTVIESFDVNPVGALTVTLPADTTSSVAYRLVARSGGNERTSTVVIQLGQACSTNWFFNAPDSIGCPAGPPAGGQFNYQNFAQGFMFRYTGSGTDRVCALQFDRNLYSCYAPQSYSETPPVTPPANQLPPAPVFQDVFYTELAIGGFWYDVIGFATNDLTASSVTAQAGEDNRLYIQTPQGIFAFDRNLQGNGQPFERITPQS